MQQEYLQFIEVIIISKWHWKFSLSNALLFVALVAAVILLTRSRMSLAIAESRLAELQESYSLLETGDNERLYALEVPSLGAFEWRWRIQKPIGNGYTLRYSFEPSADQIGEPLFPLATRDPPMDSQTINQVINLVLRKTYDGEWQFQGANSHYRSEAWPVSDPPSWLDSPEARNRMRRLSQRTLSAAPNEPLTLLLTHDGLRVWLEPEDTSAK